MKVDTIIKFRKNRLLNKICFHVLQHKGIEIPSKVIIGKNVSFPHNSFGTVIHSKTIIENNVRIYQNVTIGRADINIPYEKSDLEKIIIGDGAIICAGAKILAKSGTFKVGKNSIIAANAVLLNSTGENEVWGGVPARKLGLRKDI